MPATPQHTHTHVLGVHTPSPLGILIYGGWQHSNFASAEDLVFSRRSFSVRRENVQHTIMPAGEKPQRPQF